MPSQDERGQIGLYKNKTYTKGDGYSSWVQGFRGTNGYTATSLFARRFLETNEKEIIAEIGSTVSSTGVPYAYCTQTPTTNTPGGAIATADYVKTQAAAASMPSSKYIDLTLGASGTTYTAPANGWFSMSGRQSGGTFSATTSDMIYSRNAFNGDHYFGVYVPVKSGQILTINYNVAVTEPVIVFIYAEGDQ